MRKKTSKFVNYVLLGLLFAILAQTSVLANVVPNSVPKEQWYNWFTTTTGIVVCSIALVVILALIFARKPIFSFLGKYWLPFVGLIVAIALIKLAPLAYSINTGWIILMLVGGWFLRKDHKWKYMNSTKIYEQHLLFGLYATLAWPIVFMYDIEPAKEEAHSTHGNTQHENADKSHDEEGHIEVDMKKFWTGVALSVLQLVLFALALWFLPFGWFAIPFFSLIAWFSSEGGESQILAKLRNAKLFFIAGAPLGEAMIIMSGEDNIADYLLNHSGWFVNKAKYADSSVGQRREVVICPDGVQRLGCTYHPDYKDGQIIPRQFGIPAKQRSSTRDFDTADQERVYVDWRRNIWRFFEEEYNIFWLGVPWMARVYEYKRKDVTGYEIIENEDGSTKLEIKESKPLSSKTFDFQIELNYLRFIGNTGKEVSLDLADDTITSSENASLAIDLSYCTQIDNLKTLVEINYPDAYSAVRTKLTSKGLDYLRQVTYSDVLEARSDVKPKDDTIPWIIECLLSSNEDDSNNPHEKGIHNGTGYTVISPSILRVSGANKSTIKLLNSLNEIQEMINEGLKMVEKSKYEVQVKSNLAKAYTLLANALRKPGANIAYIMDKVAELKNLNVLDLGGLKNFMATLNVSGTGSGGNTADDDDDDTTGGSGSGASVGSGGKKKNKKIKRLAS